MTVTASDFIDLRGFSLLQPWASLVGDLKPIETRGRSVGLKIGQVVAIHASRGTARAGTEDAAARLAACRAAWGAAAPSTFTLGAIVSVGRCVDARISEGCVPPFWAGDWSPRRIAQVSSLGNFARGRVLYLFADVVTLSEPVPCKGAMGLWRVPGDVLDLVCARVRA